MEIDVDSDDIASRKSRPGVYLLIGLALVLMVLSVVLVILFPEGYSAPSVSDTGGSKILTLSCDLTLARKIYPFQEGLLRISTGRISYTDLSGNEIFGEAVDMQSPVCDTSGDFALIADTEGTSFVLLNNTGVIYSQQAAGTIDFASIASDGRAAIIYDKPETKGAAAFYRVDGTMVFEWGSVESGFIVSAHICETTESVDALTYNTDSSVPVPILKRFDFGGNALAQDYPDTENILTHVFYTRDEEAVLIGPSDIFVYADGETLHETYDDILLAAASSEHIVAAIRKSPLDLPALYIIDGDGSSERSIILSEELVFLETVGDIAVVGMGTSVICVNINKMEIDERISFNSNVIRAGLDGSGDKIVVVTGEGVFKQNISG